MRFAGVLLSSIVAIIFSPDIVNAQLEHFNPVISTGVSNPVIIKSIIINGDTVKSGLEIAVYDDTLCVGAAKCNGNLPIVFPVWLEYQPPGQQKLKGAVPGHPMSFKVWIKELNLELPADANLESGGFFGDPLTVVSDLVANFNRPPVILNLNVTPKYPTSNDTAKIGYSFMDPDGDNEAGTVILWYLNNVEQPDLKNLKVIPLNRFSYGDVLQCAVIPNDGHVAGDTVFSNPFVILPEKRRQRLLMPILSSDEIIVSDSLNGIYWKFTLKPIGPSPDSSHHAFARNLYFLLITLPKSRYFYFENTLPVYWYVFTNFHQVQIDAEFFVSDSVLLEFKGDQVDKLVFGYSEDFGENWNYTAADSSDTNQNYLCFKNIPNAAIFALGKTTFSRFLPVELLSFMAKHLDRGRVRLLWVTASETRNLGFEIQRAEKESKFRTIAFVKGSGTSNRPLTYEYIDLLHRPGVYYYRLKQIDIDGGFSFSGILKLTVDFPEEIALLQNYPNPFNNFTIIELSIPGNLSGEELKLIIYNAIGQPLKEIRLKDLSPGIHRFIWDGRDDSGRPVASGIYFLQLENTSRIIGQKKLLYLK